MCGGGQRNAGDVPLSSQSCSAQLQWSHVTVDAWRCLIGEVGMNSPGLLACRPIGFHLKTPALELYTQGPIRRMR